MIHSVFTGVDGGFMFKKTAYNLFSLLMALIVALVFFSAVFYGDNDFGLITSYATTGIVNTTRLNVRSGPGTGYQRLDTINLNTQVSINSEVTGSDGYVWYQISYSGGTGYVRSDYIYINQVYNVQDTDFETYITMQGFPESYKNSLRGLHEQYPSWIFEAQHTGLEWNTVLSEESVIGKNLVSSSSISSWKSLADGAFDWANNYWPGFDGASWVQASEELIAHYLDPRNFLQDPYVFQFEVQNYDSGIQTKEGLMTMVEGTFLDGEAIVPVEGSLIEGGEIIPGSTYTPGQSIQSEKGSDTSATGPGSSSGSSSRVIVAPGVTLRSDNSAASSPSSDTTVISPFSISSMAYSLTGILESYASGWESTDQPSGRIWKYYSDDGSNLKNGWYWLDGNKDGIAECYYFYADGTMAASTTIDSFIVDQDGHWVDENGVIQTKDADSTATSDSAGGELKSVPYVDIIMVAAQQSNLSPYVIASTILQEQGSGSSDLISGENTSYPGVYNFFNTGAYTHDGMSAVEAGLKYASEQGWDTIEKSIINGAISYASNYVNRGQNTSYLKKFNVQGSNLYNHQYMTHILAAAEEGAKVGNAYGSLKNSTLRFKIPVYNNMPETNANLPSGDGNPNNKLNALSVDGYTITPSFNMDTEEYSLIVESNITSINVQASAIDNKATVNGAGNISLASGLNYINVVVTAENGTTRTYRINVTRREDSGTNSGIQNSASGGTSVVPGNSAFDEVSPGGSASISDEPSDVVVIGQGP